MEGDEVLGFAKGAQPNLLTYFHSQAVEGEGGDVLYRRVG